MIIAGTRPAGFAERRDRARRAAAAVVEADDEARHSGESGDLQANEPVKSAVEIAPRPPSD
ncbi:hypothetical protein [Marmoricola sp. URHB0036]|uniref:hypothetical protein n=1 Tax=Marmoricola sp. URHB0036 TaxID=1298863 RepID=UPI0003FD6AF5|nr:hypothetical protein [Marmoricola sp. URHB0036]